MSVLLYDPVEEAHVLLMESGPYAGSRWSARLGVCNNPCCGCCFIDFECLPANNGSNSQGDRVQFALDVAKRAPYRDAAGKRSPDSEAFAEAVAAELQDKDWNYLSEFLMLEKKRQIENCDVRRLDAEFPPEVLRGDSTVVGYGEIFPLGAALAFPFGKGKWVAADDYCVNPDCNCHEAILQFVMLDQTGVPARENKKNPPAVRYDYQKKTFERLGTPEACQPTLQELMDGLKSSWRGLNGELKKRHRRLKALFKQALLRNKGSIFMNLPDPEFEPRNPEEPPPVRPAKIGRNDPCPCGSGKKYKKCCGA